MTALALTRLRVRRTPGIQEGFVVDGLVRGVNIIHGPNGSGKTSLTQVMEAVLWCPKDVERRISVMADYTLSGARYQVDLDAGHVGVTRDGTPASPPGLPAPELCKRYQLSLHDLLRSSDTGADFAREIAKQSMGGYDLAAAAKELGYRPKASPGGAELKRLDDARAKLGIAQDEQAALYEEARELASLETKRDAAFEAQSRARLLLRAVRHAKAAAALTLAEEEAGQFPDALSRMHGDEHEQLSSLCDRLTEQTGAVEQHRGQLHGYDADASRLFPDGPPAPETTATLRQDAEHAAQLAQSLVTLEQRATAAAADVDVRRHAIGSAVTDAQLARIDGMSLGDLADLAREGEHLHARISALQAELGRASTATPSDDPATLREGIISLSSWLREQGAPAPRSSTHAAMGWALGVVAVAGWAMLAVRGHPAAWAGVVVAVVLAIVVSRGPAAVAADGRASWERKYASLGLPRPAAWEIAAVAQCLDDLEKRLAAREIAEQRAAWRGDAERRRAELESQRESFEHRRAQAAERFGVAPDADARTLSYLCDLVARWHDASAAHASASAELATARAQLTGALERVGARLAAFGYSTPTSAAEGRGIVEALAARVAAHDELAVKRQLSVGRRADAERSVADVRREIDALLARAGIAGHEHEVAAALVPMRSLCARHAEYVAAVKRLDAARNELAVARAELESAGGRDASLLERDAAALEQARGDAEQEANAFGDLVARAAELRTKVEAAKKESDVESALAAVAQAEDELRALRARDLGALVGDLLLQHVRRRTNDVHRPQVFHRARELFALFTRGRYELELQDAAHDGVPAFRARDTRDGAWRTLDQLSSATRVQLLLAVRVAFVETQEQGVRLPLLLDETLGTSDDLRAQAIIDAVIALAEEGRQVFYFTAQHDEVVKWRASLDGKKMDWTLVDLAKVRSLTGDLPTELPVAALPPALTEVPSPGGRTHESYGAALGIPAVRPGFARASSTHLWYLFDDTGALYHLLRVLGRDATWGELELLVDSGGLGIIAQHEAAYARARALARAIDVMHEQAAIGRGKPVDRAVLSDSGAVSAAKLEEVVRVAGRHGGRAGAVLDALEAKEVPGFGAKKIADLREFLSREGYLDDEPTRTPIEIRTAMVAAMSGDVTSGRVGVSDLDELLRRIERRARPDHGEPQCQSPGLPLPHTSAGEGLPA